jgi:diacylglycerol O-acyltransferase
MSPLDAAFLQIEDAEPQASMAIASAAVFDGPAPTAAEFAELIAGRLPLIPRYRQKARQVPLDLGPPVWVDDPTFDLAYHLRRTVAPAPGGDAELAATIGEIMSERLDRDHPLWEYWIIEGLARRRWALLSKIHHCLADGVSGTALYQVILDPTPQPRPPAPDAWRPGPEPSDLALITTALRDLALVPWNQLRLVAGLLRHPTAALGRAWDVARGGWALTGAAVPARPSSLSGPVARRRSYAFSRGRLADVTAVRKAFGGTVNDVALAAAAGGFRALLLARGETPHPDTVRTLVPVSVRLPTADDTPDNRVSLMLATLPLQIADPVARLAAVSRQLLGLKDAHEAEAGAALVELAGAEPFPASAVPVRAMARLAQRSVVSVTTDVPGPRAPLFMLGRRLREIVPYVPIGSTMRIGVSIFTYCDRITFGVTGDAETVPDVDVLARAIADDLAELAAQARRGNPDPLDGGPGGGRTDAVPSAQRARVTRPRRAAPAR